jgi:hypothetical protein
MCLEKSIFYHVIFHPILNINKNLNVYFVKKKFKRIWLKFELKIFDFCLCLRT